MYMQLPNENNPLLSVIIPMYNCAPVIVRCMDSIDYYDCEIIVVNDGSKDNGAEVVAQYSFTHTNVRLINKPNGGVSSARNVGIENAKGRYISFIDADDYIVSDGLERIVKIAEEYDADVVKFKNKIVGDTDEQDKISVAHIPIHIKQTTGEGVLKRFDISDYIVWDGIYRRSVILDNDIRFMEDLCLREDNTFMGMLYCHANVVVSTDLQLYRYVSVSSFSFTHHQSIIGQRKLITSGLSAIRYRGKYVKKHRPNVMALERLKYMHLVCSLKDAINAQYTYKEYTMLLNEFRKEGVYPLDYEWIKVAGLDYSFKSYMKRVLQTFMINHPWLAWLPAKWYYKNR